MRIELVALVLVALVLMFACSKPDIEAAPLPDTPQVEAPEKYRCVMSSWYNEGTQTASGERYNPKGLTAAHKTFDFGTILKVMNPLNRKTVEVRINDRGPYIRGRELDISEGAARVLEFMTTGIGQLCYIKVS